MKEYNLLEEYAFLGEFWPYDNKDHSFYANLKYSPETGIQLSSLVDYKTNKLLRGSTILHGYSQKTGDMTLVGCYVSSTGRHTVGISRSSMSPTIFCMYLICGGHFTQQQQFVSCSFELSGFREFCYPQGFMMEDKFSSTPILEGNCSWGNVAFKKNASGNKISANNISDLIVIDEDKKAFSDALNKMAGKLAEKHNIEYLLTKKEIGTYLKISYENAKNISTFPHNNEMMKIADLFTIFAISPVVPINIKLHGEKKKSSYPVIYSIRLAANKRQRISKDVNHNLMPVNIKDIESSFPKILNEWDTITSDDTDFILSVLHEHIKGGFNTAHHTITAIAALEQWFSKYEQGEKGKHYDHMIETYSPPSTTDFLREHIPLEINKNESLGSILTKIRGSVLHPKGRDNRFFKTGHNLDECSLGNISEAIFIILMRALYQKLGISDRAIEKLGTEDRPVMSKYSLLKT